MTWSGEERRKTIMIDGQRLQELREDFISFKATITEWTNNTTEYRKNQCYKIDKIIATLGLLPCKERVGWYQSINNQIKFIWVIVTGVVIALLKELFHK